MRIVPAPLASCSSALLVLAASVAAQGSGPPSAATPAGGFVENRGQAPEEVLFHGQQGSLHLWATAEALVLALPGPEPSGVDVALRFELGAAAASVEGRGQLDGQSHFLRAGEGSVLGVNSFAQVLYRDLAPGLDLRLGQRDGALAYDLELAPGASLEGFAVQVRGAQRLELRSPAELVVHTAAGALTQTIPASWEVLPTGERRALEGRFVLLGEDLLGFALPGRDASLPAVLDPVLGFAGYLGGSACDFVEAAAVDTLGRSYVAGISQSADFPTTVGAIDTTWLNDEAFLASYDSTGASLLFATYLGGSGDDRALAIDIDDLGEHVWVVGETESIDFPVTPGAFDTTKGDFEDAFVARISADGTALDWATFLGGGNSDVATAIEVDVTGRAYVVGSTASTDFPVSAGVGQPSLAGGTDAFVTKLAATGASILVSTYYGGSSDDFGAGVAVAFGGEVIVGGTTRSNNLPTSPGALQTVRAGGDDGFVARFTASAGALVYGTFLGGSGDDEIRGLATWPSQTPYVVGRTESTDFPTSVGALFPTNQGLDDAFVSVLTADATGFLHSTYLGGSGNDAADAVALDPVGTTYVVGTTDSTDLPVTGDAFQATLGGGHDLFQFTLLTDGSAIEFGTYYGGPNDDAGHAIDHDDFTGAVCFGGHVLDGVPTTAGVHDPSFNGGSGDGFLACYTPLPCPTPAGAVTLGSPCNTALLTVPPLVQGTYVTLTITGAPPLATGLLYTSPSGAAPILWEGVCNIWVDIFAATPFVPVFTDGSGSWAQDLGLPNDAPRCSKLVTFQAVILDPAGGPASFGQLTNGVECTFGS